MKHPETPARLATCHDIAAESVSVAPVTPPSAHVDNASRWLLTREESGREEALFQPPAPRIPLSTYRLQFNRDFTFNQAREIVPYLRELGISHLYASPYLKARPGSRHGYDIIDHNALNPEIGTYEEFEQLCTTLAEHGMGQILDVVPNHMGVQGGDNAWWLDVLENGQASAHAGFFDIDWSPIKLKLHGKVLLPVLGNSYGAVLDNAELQLRFDAEHGEFVIYYYEHHFPVDPAEYPQILAYRMDTLSTLLGQDNPLLMEYQSLVTAFRNLPSRDEGLLERQVERRRDKEVYKRHLAGLVEQSSDIAGFLEENLHLFNGTAGESSSFDQLHHLIKAQAYRLAFWRVASDEINYRRFFDINDLAGLRMENDEVFDATHQLLLRLVQEGKLDLDQDVNQKRHRIGFRLWFERPHDVARQPVVGSFVNRRRPFHRVRHGHLGRSVHHAATSAYAALVAGRILADARGDPLDVLLRRSSPPR